MVTVGWVLNPRVKQRFGGATCGALLLLLGVTAQAGWGKEVIRNSSRECAICHIRWAEAFDRSPAPESRMQTILDRQAGSGDMCLSCHDGSVVDSRFQVWSTRHHTTDHVPSPAVRIPTDKFPLDEQGRMTCATCHTAHAVPDSSDLKTVIFLRQPNVDSSLCLSCHPEHAQKNDFQHPLGPTDSPIPEALLQAGGKTAADGHTIICQTCHEPHGARNAWMLVLPPSKLCIACHTSKSPEAVPGAGAPVHKIGQTYSGFKPPETLLGEKATFGPDGELTCLSCHRLHDASGAKPLLIRKNHDSSLCLECHEQEKAVLGSPHDLRQSSPQTMNAYGQTPLLSGPCGACHRIHGWARDVPETNRPHSSGCLECHKPGGPGSPHRPYIEGHPVGIALPAGKSVPLPLDEATKSIGCLTCHDPHVPHPHQAAADKSMTPVQQAEAIPAPRSFLRQEGSQLCVLCHDDKTESMHGPHDPASFAPMVRQALGLNPSIGSCRACHTTHNAQGPHLWARAPARSSTGPAADLCGACHQGNLVTKPQETHHPVSVADLGLRLADPNSTTNPQSNQVSCASCHNPHGGPSPAALLRRPAESLCTGCHEDKQRIKGSVHDPGTNEWARKLGFVSKGACVDCHPIHSPPEKNGIWAALQRNEAQASSCEVCHRVGGLGPAAETPHVGKPLRIAEAGLNSKRSASLQSALRNPQSEIRCTTCHDIHQSNQDTELLKLSRQDSSLCLTCHATAGGLVGTSHDLRLSAPETRNVRGEMAAESGPCGSCHLVHPATAGQPAEGRGRLTAIGHTSPDPQNPAAQICTCCHREDGCAAGRMPKYTEHPQVALLNRLAPEQPDYLPLFDERGEPSATGVISCPTCHAVHATTEAPGGDAFLRTMAGGTLPNPAEPRLCIDCHGLEGLWRFLYYHKPYRNPYPKRNPKPPAAEHR